MIISRSALILILASAAVSVAVVATSQKTLRLRRDLSEVQQQIEQERELIAVLESEWELFTAPTSLKKKLGTTGSALAPLTVSQIIESPAEIPVPPPRLMIEGPRETLMVSVEGMDGQVPLPLQKPGFRPRRTEDLILAVMRESATGQAPVPAATVTATRPAAMPLPAPAPERVAESAAPARPAPAPADPLDRPEDDAIGQLLIDLTLAKDALAEVPAQ